jgi:hypothetical protein
VSHLTLVVDAEIVDLTEDEATAVTGRIRTWVKACPIEDVKRAYMGRVWLSMGYDSWAEWCDCELGGFKLPAVERQEAVAELAGAGMSQRSIADVLDISRNTVASDVAQTERPDTAPPVVGQDGKTYRHPIKHPVSVTTRRKPPPDEFPTRRWRSRAGH